jgi:hypothetical protein
MFEDFIADKHVSGIFASGQMVVYDQVTVPAELVANPVKIIEQGKKVTQRVLGIGVSFVDVIKKQI